MHFHENTSVYFNLFLNIGNSIKNIIEINVLVRPIETATFISEDASVVFPLMPAKLATSTSMAQTRFEHLS